MDRDRRNTRGAGHPRPDPRSRAPFRPFRCRYGGDRARHGMNDASLTLTALACRRGGRLLFEGLNLALSRGDAALVTGANGAGKSSLLRIIAGLLAPAAGEVRSSGTIGWLGEATALDPPLTLREALTVRA